MAERVGIGNLLGDTIDLVGTAARDFLVYTLVLGTLSAVGIAAGFSDIDNGEFGMNMGFMIDESDTIFSGLFELASFLISIVASYLLVKRYLATRNRLRGDDNRFWPYFGMAILSAIGFPTTMFTALFALARTVGWVAQWNEMISDPGQVIGRPRQLYTGPTERDYIPLDKR